MSDFTTETVQKLPRITKTVKLLAGQKLADDADVLAFAQKSVPVGKVATISVDIHVIKLTNE